jgi:hypothetical protein
MANVPPNIVQVAVPRHDVNLTMQDLMAPLTQFAQQPHVAQAVAATPEVQQHATDLGNLAQQVLEVANRLNAVAPHLLAPTPAPAPPTPAPPQTPGSR